MLELRFTPIPEQSAPRPVSLRQKALAGLAVSAVSLFGAGEAQASAEHLPAEPSIEITGHQAAVALANIHPTGQHEGISAHSATKPNSSFTVIQPKVEGSGNAKFSKEIRRSDDRDSVFMEGLGCSGEALRNPKGEVVGAITAEHCSLTDQKHQRISGSDGNLYIIQPKIIKARTGTDKMRLKTVAKIDRFIVSSAADKTRDLALGVARGHTTTEALKAYRAQAMSPRDIAGLPAGTTLHMAGWPDYKGQDKNGNSERQAFDLKVLGMGKTDTTEGKSLNVLWTSVTPTKDGAVCSYGNSGGVAKIFKSGRERTIGTLSSFIDLTKQIPYNGSPATTSSKTKKQNVSPSNNPTALCGFTYELPDINSMTILHAVRNASEIPGYQSPEQSIQQAVAEFKDPTYTKTVINGIIPISKGGPASGPGKGREMAAAYVKNPLVFRHANGHNTVIAWVDAQDPEHLNLFYMEDRNISRCARIS